MLENEVCKISFAIQCCNVVVIWLIEPMIYLYFYNKRVGHIIRQANPYHSEISCITPEPTSTINVSYDYSLQYSRQL